MPVKKNKKLSMEELLAEVNESIERLQSGKLTFEENVLEYQKASQYLKDCSEKMEQAEKELIIIEEEEFE